MGGAAGAQTRLDPGSAIATDRCLPSPAGMRVGRSNTPGIGGHGQEKSAAVTELVLELALVQLVVNVNRRTELPMGSFLLARDKRRLY
jgi:hypothetical protein